jgi:hypothetical protein
MSDLAKTHAHNTRQGITFIWVLNLVGMFVLISLFALSELGGDVVSNEIDLLAAGSVNAIGLVALGGVNAIGVVSLGMINSVGVVAIGGVNSVGVIAIGGYNATGLITIGGVKSNAFPIRLWGAALFDWNPRIAHLKSDPA